jgi:osmotically-inducible protein OsmY
MKKILVGLFLTAAMMLAACGGKSDADLQKAAETAVKAKAPTATVTVKDGVATVKGEVADAATKTAVAAAAKVEGVKEVKDETTVKPPPAPAAATSGDKTKIEEALKKAGFPDVTVDVSGPQAVIRGTVAKGKMQDAVKAATEAAGKPVKNEVTEK